MIYLFKEEKKINSKKKKFLVNRKKKIHFVLFNLRSDKCKWKQNKRNERDEVNIGPSHCLNFKLNFLSKFCKLHSSNSRLVND